MTLVPKTPSARGPAVSFLQFDSIHWRRPRADGEHVVLKDTAMLKRLNDIASFPDEDKKHILYTLDALIKNVKLKAIYNSYCTSYLNQNKLRELSKEINVCIFSFINSAISTNINFSSSR